VRRNQGGNHEQSMVQLAQSIIGSSLHGDATESVGYILNKVHEGIGAGDGMRCCWRETIEGSLVSKCGIIVPEALAIKALSGVWRN